MEYYHGVCRCCLAKGSFKRLEREYQWLGDREIYIVMMQECFGLSVAGGDESERLICEVCITRLRDASNFKKQVIVSEKYFQMSVDDSSNQELMEFPKPMLSPGNVKKEELDDDYNSAADDTAFEYDVPVKVEDAKPEPCEKEPVRITVRVNSKKRQTRKKTKKNEASTSNTSVQPDKIGPPKDTACPKVKIKVELTKAKLVMESHECLECGVSFSNELIKHQHNLYHERFFDRPKRKCPDCGQWILSVDILKHIKVEHKQNPFVCEVCGTFFTSQQRLRYHKAHIHDRPTRKDFKCGQTCHYCEEVFPDKDKRLKHYIRVHREKSLQLECGACGKIFGTKHRLRQHQKRIHLMEKRYKCEQCDFASFDKRHVIEHKITHTGEKKFRCEVCGKRMARARALASHMRIHNNDKRKVCPVCGQAFVQKASLTYHITKHHPEYV